MEIADIEIEQFKARILELENIVLEREKQLNELTKNDGINHFYFENISSSEIKVRLSDLVLKDMIWRSVRLHLV